MPPADSYSSVDVTNLNTRRTPIQKQPEVLLCLVGLSRNYFLGDNVYPTFLYDDDREMDLFNLISAPNPLKVKTGVRPRAAHEIIAERVGTEGQVQDELSREIPSVGHATTAKVGPETSLEEEVATIGPSVNKRRKQMRRKSVNDEAKANAPPKVLRKDHVSSPAYSANGEKSLAAMGLGAGSISSTPVAQGTPTIAKSVSDPDPLSYAKPQPYPEQDIAQSSRGTAIEILTEYVSTTEINVQFFVGSSKSGKSTSVPFVVGSPGVSINRDFLSQYNINLAWQVAMGSQLRLRSVDVEVHGLCNQTKNLKTLLEAEADMKKAAEVKNVELAKELDSLRVQFSDLQVSNDQLSQQRCAEIDARLDALSIDFDEDLYPHMMMAIAGRRWVIGHGLRLAVLKCVESIELRQAFADVVSAGIAKGMSGGLKHRVEHEKAKLDLAAIEGYDPEAKTKYVAALHALKNLKYPLVDQLEKLKDAPTDLIMASLYLESDSGEDAP
ncbi:hypothetical protein Tco_0928171 [Tanacetum coccineum]